MDSQKNMTHAAKTICISSSQVILTTPQGTPEIAPAFVEISGNVISQITRVPALSYSSELAKLKLQTTGPKNFELHDFGSFVVAPAWVNAHTHLAMNFFRGLAVESQVAGNLVHDLFFGLESHLKPDDVRAFSRVAAYECLLSGTGLVWDHYYHAEAAAQGIADTGLCAVVAPTLQDLSGPGCQLWQQHLDQTLSIQANSALRSAGIYAALGPHATDTVSAPFWKKIIDTAKAHTLPVHVHLAQSPEEFQHSMDRNQQSPAAFLHSTGLLSESIKCTLVHNIYCSQSDFALFEPEFHTLVFCPSSQLVFHFPANVMVWEKNRATWCVATDCAASNDTMNVQRELAQVGGTVAQSLTASANYEDFLQSGTQENAAKTNAARIASQGLQTQFSSAAFLLQKVWQTPGKMHPQFQAGTLQAGALANIAVWNTDHPNLWPAHSPLRSLAMSDCSPALHNLMCAGKWIGTSGAFQDSLLNSGNYKNALDEAKSRLIELRFRAGI